MRPSGEEGALPAATGLAASGTAADGDGRRHRARSATLRGRIDATLRDLRALDGAVYAAVAATPAPTLDTALRRLSQAADHSRISFALAAGLATVPGRPRQAAAAGVCAIAVASASADLVGKRLVRRSRPDREAARVAMARHVPMPASASFPSGHTASAVAFAAAVGSVLPLAGPPLGLLAAAVGYSRVHTGVHYPGDVAAGALLGLASAAAVRECATCRRIRGPLNTPTSGRRGG